MPPRFLAPYRRLPYAGLRLWEITFSMLDRLPAWRGRTQADHLRTGQRGEEAALFYLRRCGFLVVAHNWRSGRAPGDLDLVGWEQDTLCFVEVKTRTTRTIATAESAIDRDKRHSLRRLARHYLRQHPTGTLARFDVLSVYLERGRGPSFELYRNAFPWDEGAERLAL